MSYTLLRTVNGLRSGCLRTGTRQFATATEAKAKSSGLALYLGGAGLLGLGAYAYLQRSGAAATVVPKKVQEKSPLDPDNFVDFKLKKVEPYNHNTSKFVFELPNDEASLLPVASCVIVKSSDPERLKNDNGKPVIRPYTPISPSDAPGELTFLVKKYPEGKASVHIHDLKPGETLAIKGPIPKFPYKVNEFDEVALIGGGSGITPLYQVLEHALADKANKTKFTLIYANLTPKDILLREEFDEMKKKFPDNLNVIYFVDKADKEWKGKTGYVTKDALKESLPAPELGNKAKVFICGPPGQVAAVAGKKDGMKQGALGGLLKELGYSEDQVYKF